MEFIKEDLYKNHLSDYISQNNISQSDWEMFYEHISTHKYWLNQGYKNEISMDSAYSSWLEYVFEPFLWAIHKNKILEFSDLNIIELYSKIMNDWYFMKSRTPKEERMIGVHDAVDAYYRSLNNLSWWDRFKIRIRVWSKK